MQATLYSLKSLNINATKVASYDKLKVELYEAIGEKARLEGQFHQAIEDRERYKSKRNLSRGEKAKLEDRITELLSRITKLEVEVASLTSQLKTEHQRAENSSKDFYESKEYLNLENTNINLEWEEVFYTVLQKYPNLEFSFLRESVLGVIKGFKAKLVEDATPLTEIPDDEVRQAGKMVEEIMDKDERRQQ